jgi:predicted nucleotidyltransferase
MLSPKQIKIFEAFLKTPYKALTFKDIKEYSHGNSNSVIQNSISKFLSDELVKRESVGNILLYSLNLGNSAVFSYFDILIRDNLSVTLKKTLRIIEEELSSEKFISIVLFGSYAKGLYTKDSDLDIVVFVNSLDDKRRCELSLKSASLKTLIDIDAHVFTKDEMLMMLKDKKGNLGKQIAYNNIPLYNPSIFNSIIMEGIDNGFKIAYS